MKLEQHLRTEMRQELQLSQQLLQSLQLLLLNRLEMVEAIQQELEQNPMLEDEAESPDPKEAGPADAEPAPAAKDKDHPMDLDEGTLDRAVRDEPAAVKDEVDWDSYFQDYMRGPTESYRFPEQTDEAGFETFIAAPTGLHDHLLSQLALIELSPDERRAGVEVIGSINENGYLEGTSLADIAQRFGLPSAAVERVHRRIMELDPVGVGARDVKECLLVQAIARDDGSRLLPRVISQNWEAVAGFDWKLLMKVYGLGQREVEQLYAAIRELDPKPGRAFADLRTTYVTPDVIIRREGERFLIELAEEGIPRLRINRRYVSQLYNPNLSAADKKYIREKMNASLQFIRNIDRRRKTIRDVAERIVERQRPFFESGSPEELRPMTLRDISDDLGYHQSTISRVTANKYAQTPHGMFELKYFFNKLIGDEESSATANTLRQRVQEVIEKEDPANPLSDNQIQQILRSSGIDVSRRTITKYRELLNIPSKHMRRRRHSFNPA